jgi:hypothetical protein
VRPRYQEEEEEEEEEILFKADAVNEEDPERDRATQVVVEEEEVRAGVHVPKSKTFTISLMWEFFQQTVQR